MGKVFCRMGDGFPLEMTKAELVRDLEAGTADAADRGKISPLSKEELDYLADLFNAPYRFVGVPQGKEVVLTYDGILVKLARAGVPVDRVQAMMMYEKMMGADTLELGHVDYSFKPVKPIVATEQLALEQALLVTHAPLFYGAMPNLGLYSQPDGPFPNPSELLPQGKIRESREAYELAVEEAVKDIVYVATAMVESGADGINLDTTGAAGDADFLAGLKATEILKQKYPDLCVEMGMAGEFILGLHGELSYDGVRLAGLYAHQQVDLAQKAGVSIFGPVVNTKTNRSCAWNLSRAVTFMKACTDVAQIPIHVNMGMGVGGVTMTSHPPLDMASRASTAMVEICRLDGL